MFKFLLLFFSSSLLSLPAEVCAAIYQWKDANGVVHFSDAPREGATVVTPKDVTIYQSTKSEPVTFNTANISVTLIHYDIYPFSRRDLSGAAFAATPIRANGKPFLGNARWDLKWNYKTKQANGECWIGSVDLRVLIVYTLPRLGSREMLSDDVVQAFDRYYANLLLHEEGHGNHGKLAGKEIEEMFLRIPRQKSCAAIGPITAMRANGVIAKYKNMDRQYDHDTAHGRTQGADIGLYVR